MAPDAKPIALLICVLLLVVSAGCLGIFGDDKADSGTVRFVPEGADGVLRVNVTALHDQPTTERFFDGLAEREGSRYYESYDAFLAEAENTTGLDPRGLEEMTAFVDVSDGSFTADDAYAGVVFRAEWNLNSIVDAVPEGVTVKEREYNDESLYVFTSNTTRTTYMTRLSENVYAVGTEDAVRDASDVSRNGAEPLGGVLREELDERKDENVAFAVSASQEAVTAVPGSELPPEVLNGISDVSGSYRTDPENGTVGVSASLIPSEGEDPENVRQTVDGFLSLAGMVAENDETTEAIDSVDVTVEDSEVAVSYETSVEDAVRDFRVLNRRFRLTERLERSIAIDFGSYAVETGGDKP
jgi:hypothetical protein